MRKIKKINGFLVVRFNDREKRNYDGEQHRAQKAVGAEKGTRHRIPPLKIAFNTI